MGNRTDDSGQASTVEQDLYDYARWSKDWRLASHSTAPNFMGRISSDLNVEQEQDDERLEIWQQIPEYAHDASMVLSGTMPKLCGRNVIQRFNRRRHDQLLAADFPLVLRQRIQTASDMLDSLARAVRLRALLSRTNFGEPWNCV